MSEGRTVRVFALDAIDGQWAAAARDLPTPPPGWTQHVVEAVESGEIVRLASSRLGRPNGVYVVAAWLRRHLEATHGDHGAWAAGEVTYDFGRA